MKLIEQIHEAVNNSILLDDDETKRITDAILKVVEGHAVDFTDSFFSYMAKTEEKHGFVLEPDQYYPIWLEESK